MADALAIIALAEPGQSLRDVQYPRAGLTYSNCGRQNLFELQSVYATACERRRRFDAQNPHALAEPGQFSLDAHGADAGLTLSLAEKMT